jgi:hypothetical protein
MSLVDKVLKAVFVLLTIGTIVFMPIVALTTTGPQRIYAAIPAVVAVLVLCWLIRRGEIP